MEREPAVERKKLADFETRLGYAFKDPTLLREALNHSSYAAEHNNTPRDNQRLEFLGDAVLQLVATDALFRRYPDQEEGHLTRMRSLVTNEEALVRMARVVSISEYLYVGKGERMSGGLQRPSNQADAFEAVIGAIYLDGGLTAAAEFLICMMEAALPDPLQQLGEENPKGRLQELTQERYSATPEYDVLSVTGPEHDPEFEVLVKIRGELFATATAGNRKEAEKQAARLALRKILQAPSSAPAPEAGPQE